MLLKQGSLCSLKLGWWLRDPGFKPAPCHWQAAFSTSCTEIWASGISHLDHGGSNLTAGTCVALFWLPQAPALARGRKRGFVGVMHNNTYAAAVWAEVWGDLGNATDKSLSEPLVNRKVVNSFTIFLSFLGSFGLIFIAILFRLPHLRKHIFLPPLAGNVQNTKCWKPQGLLSPLYKRWSVNGLAMRASECPWQKLEV